MSIPAEPLARHGKIHWLCDPPDGVARVRVESAGESALGELLAVTYSAFMATELADRLERNKVPARELVVHARCGVSGKPASVREFEVEVIGRVPGIDEERLRTVAGVALAYCRASLGMRRGLRTKLHVSLER